MASAASAAKSDRTPVESQRSTMITIPQTRITAASKIGQVSRKYAAVVAHPSLTRRSLVWGKACRIRNPSENPINGGKRSNATVPMIRRRSDRAMPTKQGPLPPHRRLSRASRQGLGRYLLAIRPATEGSLVPQHAVSLAWRLSLCHAQAVRAVCPQAHPRARSATPKRAETREARPQKQRSTRQGRPRLQVHMPRGTHCAGPS